MLSVAVAVAVLRPAPDKLDAQAGSLALAFAFSETSGTVAADLSGNGNTATLINGPAWTSGGKFGNGLAFDGVNDRIEVADSETLQLSTAFTFEAWMKPTVDQWHAVWGKGPNSGTYILWLRPGMVPMFEAWLSNGYKEVTAPNRIALNAWTHVAITYDGAMLRLYLNGTEVDSTPATGTLPMSAEPFLLGDRGGAPLAGVLDEVRVYRTALSASDVAHDMVTPLDESTPFQTVSTTPLPGAVGVLTTPIAARFSRPVDAATVSSSSFELRDPANALVSATVDYDAVTRTTTLTPSGPLATLTDYTGRVGGGASGVRDTAGNTLAADTQWTFRTAAAATAPSAAYGLSETSGNVAVDASGNGNTAALISGPIHVPGWSGNGLGFDGINDRVEIPVSETLQLSTALTFEAWVQPTADQWHIILTKGPTGGTYALWIKPGLVPMFEAWLSNGYKEVTAPGGIALNAWTHLAVTYDSATLRLYVNGSEVTSTTATGSLPMSNLPWQLGDHGPGGTPFSGVMDEVRMYRRALSGAEIVDDMNASVDDTTPPTVTSTSPLAGAVDVNPGGNITASFSEALLPSTVTAATFALRDPGGNLVPAAITYSQSTDTATLDPTARLTNLTTYTVTLRGGGIEPRIVDLHGNALATDFTWTFTTADAETTPPTIVAEVRPEANASGWHNSPVTVTFSCADASGMASCQAPIAVLQNGTDQIISGTAVDSFGNQATANVTVDVDQAAGSVVIESPVDGATTSDSSIAIVGDVSDALSGIVSAKCNGTPAAISAGAVQCIVPLNPGLNELTLQAFDAAGNSASAGVRVTRSASASELIVSPGARTLAIEESAVLTVRSEHGLIPEGTVWSSSDPGIASVTSEGVVTAVAAGEAAITATAGGLSAQSTITVVTTVVAGTSRWQVPPTPGLIMQPPIYANRVDDDGPDLFTVETAEGALPLIRALRADGTQLWTQTAPGTPQFGDAFGGLVSWVQLDPTDPLVVFWGADVQATRSLARVGGPANAPPWRFESPGWLEGKLAQAPDGTIYAVERVERDPVLGEYDTDSYALALDGSSGAVKFRVPLQRVIHEGTWCPSPQSCTTDRYELPPQVSPPSIGADGSAYFQVTRHEDTLIGRHVPDGPQDVSGSRSESGLWLLRIAPSGTPSWTPLCQQSGVDETAVHNSGISPLAVVPEPGGGVLAEWYTNWSCVSGPSAEQVINHVNAAGTVVRREAQAPNQSGFPTISLVGDDTAYIASDGVLTARDISTWNTKWSMMSDGVPVMATGEGRLLVQDAVSGTLTEVDAGGGTTAAGSLLLSRPVSAFQFGRWEGLGAGALVSLAGHEAHPSVFSFVADGGSNQRNYAPRTMHTTIDRAAITALQFYNPLSIEENREHGGSICKENEKYFASVPNAGAGFSDQVIPTGCSVGARVGDYHTHAKSGNDGFSSGDISRADLDHSGDVYVKYFVATPCGNIDKYVGPNFVVYVRLPDKTRTPIICSP